MATVSGFVHRLWDASSRRCRTLQRRIDISERRCEFSSSSRSFASDASSCSISDKCSSSLGQNPMQPLNPHPDSFRSDRNPRKDESAFHQTLRKDLNKTAATDGFNIIEVDDLALRMRDEVRAYTRTSQGTVRLVGVLAEDDRTKAAATERVPSDAEVYSQNVAATLVDDGIEYHVCRCSNDNPSTVEAVIRDLNQRDDVHGILVFYPIFKRLSSAENGPFLDRGTGVRYKTHDDYLRDAVDPAKDVEGLCQYHSAPLRRRLLFRARTRTAGDVDRQPFIPCTALAVWKVLQAYHHNNGNPLAPLTPYDQPWAGETMTVINRSELLGRPLAALLALDGATVYSVDETSVLEFHPTGAIRRCPPSWTLDECLRRSSAVVTAVPSPDFVLPATSLRPGATVVNVSEHDPFDPEALRHRTGPPLRLIRHVGPVTIAALEQNLIRLHRRSLKE